MFLRWRRRFGSRRDGNFCRPFSAVSSAKMIGTDRLSRYEDEEMNSLQNQRQLLLDYAEQNGCEVVGESFDDNVSGTTFNRKGLGELESAAAEGKIDTVPIKDLSRPGRHKTQTALFIDHLRENKVKVISVTDGIDTAGENDDLLIGFKHIFNVFYAKDIGKKFRAGIRQKQKTGLIVNLPIGYYKDKNTGKVLVDETAAEISPRGVPKIYRRAWYNRYRKRLQQPRDKVSDANLRMLLNQVKVFNDEEGGVDVAPEFNGDFNRR